MTNHPSHSDAPGILAGRLLVVAAALMWSTSGLFAKAPYFNVWPEDVRGPLLAFWRAAFATLVLVPLVRRPRWTPMLVPMTVAFTVMNIAYLSALAKTTAANAIWLQYTAPLWVFLAGAFYLREQITGRDWLLLVFGMLGVGTILLFEVRGAAPAGVAFGLLAGAAYAGVVLSVRWLRHEDAAWLVALCHVIAAAALAPFAAYQGINHGLWPTTAQFALLAGFGVFQMGIPYVLFARGLRSIAGHEASALTLVEPVLVPLWVWLVWRNWPSYTLPDWWTHVGGGLILVGLLLRYIGPRPVRR